MVAERSRAIPDVAHDRSRRAEAAHKVLHKDQSQHLALSNSPQILNPVLF